MVSCEGAAVVSSTASLVGASFFSVSFFSASFFGFTADSFVGTDFVVVVLPLAAVGVFLVAAGLGEVVVLAGAVTGLGFVTAVGVFLAGATTVGLVLGLVSSYIVVLAPLDKIL